MAWKTINRNQPAIDEGAAPELSEAVREKIRSFFGRYESKRAALLPALHIVQDAIGHVSWSAMKEIAEILEIHPSNVIDTISFYTHFWTHAKGKKVITVCRSLSCEVMGGAEVLDQLKEHLGIEEHETTSDGAYSLVTEECLAGCDHAPCLLINEKMHKCVPAEEVSKILADENNDRIVFERSDLFDAPVSAEATESANGAGGQNE
jgi:NADH-quinone oxidoreductase subunit E